MPSGLVFNIQRYSIHDGPGIRSTVFLKGCPLCCTWCHNPEGLSPRLERVVVENRCIACGACREACPFGESVAGQGRLPLRHDQCIDCAACVEACPTGARQTIGRVMSPADVMEEVLKDRVFYEDSDGGVTFSGGEPLMQPRFLQVLLHACCAQGIHTTLDTTGFGCREDLLAAAAVADLVLYDLKAFDEARHRQLTGVSNRVILENLKALDEAQCDIWIRLPLVPGFTDDLGELKRIADFVAGLRRVTLVNLLPFHRTALHKWKRLGLAHSLEGVSAPSAEFIERAAETFTRMGLKTKAGG